MNAHISTRLSSLTLAALATFSFASTARLALAGPADGPSLTVSYADLNLSNPAGAAALYRRIQQAARTICGRNGTRDLHGNLLSSACYESAVENAVATVDAPMLTAMHRNGKLPATASIVSQPTARR